MKSEIATFAQVFPDTTLWNPDLLEEGYDLVALGRVEPAPISEAAIAARLDAAPRVEQSLGEVLLKSAAAVLGTYAGRGRDLAPWLADAEINRERHLRLQYLAGLAANTDERFLIFQAILQYRRYPADLFVASAELESQMRQLVRAAERSLALLLAGARRGELAAGHVLLDGRACRPSASASSRPGCRPAGSSWVHFSVASLPSMRHVGDGDRTAAAAAELGATACRRCP